MCGGGGRCYCISLNVGTERSVDVLRENLYEADLKTKVGALSALEKIASDEAVDALSEFVRKQTGPPFALAVSSLRVANPHRAMPKLLRDLAGTTRRIERR